LEAKATSKFSKEIEGLTGIARIYGANIVEKQRHLGFVWEFNLGKKLVFSPSRNLGPIHFGFQLTNIFFLLEG